MLISQQDAQRIANEMKGVLHRNINVIDENSIIIASTDAQRIGQSHAGAKKILSENLESLVVSENSDDGMREGINLPITFHGQTVGVIGMTGPPAEVSLYGAIIKKMTEILVAGIWQQEQESQLSDARALFLENWLFSDAPDWDELLVRGRLLGIDIDLPRTVIMLRVSAAEDGSAPQEIQSTSLLRMVRLRLSADPQDLCAVINQRILILLHEESRQAVWDTAQKLCTDIEGFCQLRIWGGISSVAARSRDIRRCYLEAKAASRMAAQSPRSWIAFYNDASLEFVAQSVPKEVKTNLLQLVFSGCTDDEFAEVYQTLKLYFQYNGRIDAAAAHLFLHRNSFQYRLKKTERLTGYSLRDPKDVATLYLALQFYEENNS